MNAKAFLDTNIFVYMQSAQDLDKRNIALQAVDSCVPVEGDTDIEITCLSRRKV